MKDVASSIIEWIDKQDPSRPFAMLSVKNAVRCHHSTANDVLQRLFFLRYLTKAKRGFLHKLWWVNKKFHNDGLDLVKETYEIYMTTRLSSRGRLR